MDDVRMLAAHWEKSPPVHVMLAGFFGVGKSDAAGAASTKPDDVRAFVDEFKRSHGHV